MRLCLQQQTTKKHIQYIKINTDHSHDEHDYYVLTQLQTRAIE